MVCRAVLALSEQTLGEFETEQPAHAVIEFSSGATLVSAASLYYGNSSAESAFPDDLAVLETLLNWAPGVAPLGETIWGPTGGDLYDVLVTDVQSRIVALTLFEVSLNEPGPFDEGYATGTPILDAQREELTEYARLAWKQQAAPLFTWNVDNQDEPRSDDTGTVKNLIDDTSATVTAAKPGLTLDLRFRNRLSSDVVLCEFHAYGVCTDEGYVRLLDSTGATVGQVAITSTPGWHVGTAELPATLAKYDLHYGAQPLGETLEVSAVCLMQYETGV